jgi:hypothetical protein
LGSLVEACEVAEVMTFMLTRPRGVTIRNVVARPANFDLQGPKRGAFHLTHSPFSAVFVSDLGF